MVAIWDSERLMKRAYAMMISLSLVSKIMLWPSIWLICGTCGLIGRQIRADF